MKFKPSLLACAVLSGLVGLTGCNDDTTNIYEGGDTNPALPDIPDGWQASMSSSWRWRL